MNLNELNFDFGHKQGAKKGRRANTSAQSSIDSDNFDSGQMPIAAKKSGWADETLKSAKNRTSTNLIEQQRFQEQKTDFDDKIPTVPDIEEIQDEYYESDVAKAPAHASTGNNASTYKELDKDLLKKNPLMQLGDIDISFLTRFMYSKDQVKQTDDTWTRESLFQELIANSSCPENT